ncbi:helix-turn-helix domain-containing protein [uncultured Psychroserpens sp.]|uniref:helix-turn-helix domain-containing protein n=1 Tax=uncultured Psychroserpens sp. TaxID=255436 RepID=UPI0026130A1B|nr:helix-turn-helix domain-containing protein [uncultured Psychroserpens sp.]
MDSLGASAFVLTFLLGGTILIGLFVIVVLFRARSLGISRWFLAALLFFLILHLDTFLLFTTEIIKQYPNLLGLSYPTLFLLGPSYFLFVKSFNTKRFTFNRVDMLHTLPFIIAFIEQFTYLMQPTAAKVNTINYYYKNIPDGNVTFIEWLSANLFIILFFIYVVVSLKVIKSKFNGNKSVLNRISWTLIILCVFYMIFQTGFLITGVSAITTEIVLASLMAITILLLSYSVVDIKDVFSKKKTKYETSPLNKSEQILINEKLTHAVAVEKMYLKTNLKIKDLSVAIDVPSHHISQVLSEHMNISFYDFINSYRIEEAKQLFKKGTASKLSIQAIGEECGFGNKTSFYRAFKKFTNETPNSYFSKIAKEL